ncbi:MAG: hypothetical protein LUQ31_06230 [Methanoregula sp.]|nr:hypothetical protein [Methanoregula sp.]
MMPSSYIQYMPGPYKNTEFALRICFAFGYLYKRFYAEMQSHQNKAWQISHAGFDPETKLIDVTENAGHKFNHNNNPDLNPGGRDGLKEQVELLGRISAKLEEYFAMRTLGGGWNTENLVYDDKTAETI